MTSIWVTRWSCNQHDRRLLHLVRSNNFSSYTSAVVCNTHRQASTTHILRLPNCQVGTMIWQNLWFIFIMWMRLLPLSHTCQTVRSGHYNTPIAIESTHARSWVMPISTSVCGPICQKYVWILICFTVISLLIRCTQFAHWQLLLYAFTLTMRSIGEIPNRDRIPMYWWNFFSDGTPRCVWNLRKYVQNTILSSISFIRLVINTCEIQMDTHEHIPYVWWTKVWHTVPQTHTNKQVACRPRRRRRLETKQAERSEEDAQKAK